MTKPKTEISIQYLRAIAALMVVVFHVFSEMTHFGYRGEWHVFLASGVDIFFVISGFIMWYITSADTISPAAFYRKRIARIVPLYWLMTSAVVAVFLIRPQLLSTTRLTFGRVICSFLFIPFPSSLPPHKLEPVLVTGWTLNYEMFFYLIFGLCLFLPRERRFFALIAVLLACVTCQQFHPAENSLGEFYSSSILLEFGGGVAIAYAFSRGRVLGLVPSLALVPLGAISLILFASNDALPALITRGLPALAIVAGAISIEQQYRIPNLRIPRLFGDASYSIYLSHALVLSAITQLWRRVEPSNATWNLVLFALLATLTASLAGLAVYRWIEVPLQALVHRRRIALSAASSESAALP
ncbi:MAG TPA: acyltransferase [Rhizomicrobium sp.]|nr:acyltransferase [Rhizomicrobium sp.]